MKTFKVICAATVLALSLSIPVFAEDPKPGDNHEPGRPACTLEMPCDAGDAESTNSTLTVDNDLTLLAVVDIFWTMTSIF